MTAAGSDASSRGGARHEGACLVGCALLFLAAALICPLFGAQTLSFSRIWSGFTGQPTADADIFFFQRVPRVALGLLAGGTLAAVGAAFQVILRNPLAEPFTLGITGGAALGAVVAISVPGLWFSWGPFSTVQLCALLGAALVLTLIYGLARRRATMSMNTLLLAGVTVSLFCGSLVMLVRYLVNPHLVVQMDRWMMGGLDVVGYRELASLTPLLVPGLALLFLQGGALNQLTLGDELALGHGVEVAAVQRDVFLAGGMATAAVVALTGPIGFIGLVVPHIVRRTGGYNQRMVLPASFLLGGATLAACDALARTVVEPSEMPVGIVTALIGCPVFVRILLRSRF